MAGKKFVCVCSYSVTLIYVTATGNLNFGSFTLLLIQTVVYSAGSDGDNVVG